MMKYVLFVLISLLLAGCDKEPDLPFTFWEEPFISPQIIEEMEGWISDTGDQIVTINLTESQDSNRYNADFEITKRPGEFPLVGFCYAEGCTFSYQKGRRYLCRETAQRICGASRTHQQQASH